MAVAGIAAPVGINAVRVGGEGYGKPVFKHIYIGRRQSDLDFTRPICACCIEHHVAVSFFFAVFLFVCARI